MARRPTTEGDVAGRPLLRRHEDQVDAQDAEGENQKRESCECEHDCCHRIPPCGGWVGQYYVAQYPNCQPAILKYMEHDAHLVDILDRTGAIVSSKRRIDINKPRDIYHTVHIILVTPRGEVVMSTIPVREDLPNLYAQRLGTTTATIRRTDETPDEAADRCMMRELFIDHMPLKLLGQGMYHLPQDRHNYMSVFYGISEAPHNYSLIDIGGFVVMTPREIDHLVKNHPDKLADTFIAVWHDFRKKLPL
jgi:hypothetical protein